MDLITSKFHMVCGCILEYEDLIVSNGRYFCKFHEDFGRIKYIIKYCTRCGFEMKLKSSSFRKILCDSCTEIIKLGRIIRYQYNLPKFVDPILWNKKIDDIIEDLWINFIIGHEAIQIDSPRGMQKEGKKITIDLKRKIKILKDLYD